MFCRLEGLIQQEKATAVNLGSQLREETRRLQQRLDSLGADHDAATRQHDLYMGHVEVNMGHVDPC